MREERVEYFSAGTRVRGIWRAPLGDGPHPAVVQGPGWLGRADAKAYRPWHEALVQAGYAVLCADYRGHGDSDGERGWILPERMVEDLINAVTYLETRADVDPGRIGALGMGGIGAGNAVLAAARDPRIRCVALQSIVADGEEWLRRSRREHEWIEFRRRVAEDARRYVATGESELVDPRTEILVATPERAAYTGKADVDAKMEPRFHLQSAAALLRYKPVDEVHRIAPRGLLLLTVAGDTVTPDDHAQALYDRAAAPKRLVRQHGTSHYESYTKNFEPLAREIVDWFDAHLTASAFEVQEERR